LRALYLPLLHCLAESILFSSHLRKMNANLYKNIALTDDEMEKYSIVEIPFSVIL